MASFLRLYGRILGAIGALVLGAALLHASPDWADLAPFAMLVVGAAATRTYQIPLTKYSALNLLGMIAVGGGCIVGARTTAIALYVGVLVADWLILRKTLEFAWINAGR